MVGNGHFWVLLLSFCRTISKKRGKEIGQGSGLYPTPTLVVLHSSVLRSIFTSSTSKISTELGGIFSPAPRSP
uniref:Putative secreted protein n=1 Tax=Anopheles triannulatus TaxID=58253 RepID=A0A2M4B4E3_9DIPT